MKKHVCYANKPRSRRLYWSKDSRYKTVQSFWYQLRHLLTSKWSMVKLINVLIQKVDLHKTSEDINQISKKFPRKYPSEIYLSISLNTWARFFVARQRIFFLIIWTSWISEISIKASILTGFGPTATCRWARTEIWASLNFLNE